MSTHTAYFRFYEELNDFLPEEKRKVEFEHNYIDKASIKDMVEVIGVPHTEIDLILVNGRSVDFSYIVKDGDFISVYPVFESFNISGVQRLRQKPLRVPKFVLDVHLGTLAKYMRMIGIDTLYSNNYSDKEIVNISIKENRTILTKDRGILKRSKVTHGYWVRNINPEEQLAEIVKRFDLKNEINEFTRCMECNTPLEIIEKNKIENRLPPKVKKYHSEFSLCPKCNKIYWKGSHYEKMISLINKLKNF